MTWKFLKRLGYKIRPLTIHKYMNKELKLSSITRKYKPQYVKERPHRIFKNILKRDFTAENINEKW
ncbi:MAG: hypothetical protein ACTTIZ_03090 [Treponema sp.]